MSLEKIKDIHFLHKINTINILIMVVISTFKDQENINLTNINRENILTSILTNCAIQIDFSSNNHI